MRSKKLFAGFAALALCSAALTAFPVGRPASAAATSPTVTGLQGARQDGASLTVSGYGFGANPHAAPLKHDRFENGVSGANLKGSQR